MDLKEIKQVLKQKEIQQQPLSLLTIQATPENALKVFLTNRLYKKCKKANLWNSVAMLTSLKNISYGYSSTFSRSRGGSDGIFRLDRNFQPTNEMIKKIFTKFLDKPDPLVKIICNTFDCHPQDLIPIRVVSHHMRLLGVFYQHQIALVDFDK